MGSPGINYGTQTPWSTEGEYNRIIFAIRGVLNLVQTATLVEVVACTNTGDVDAIGTVDVTPLVNQVDGNGNPFPHGTVFALPYLRNQAGANGIIMDPQAGDIGAAVFANRDISSVKSTKAQANPGSSRKFDFADGMYLGSVISLAAPSQYIQFSEDGITAVSTGDMNLSANGNIIMAGDTIQAGSSPVAVCSKPLYTWINSTLLPALATAGIMVAAPPANSITTTFEAS